MKNNNKNNIKKLLSGSLNSGFSLLETALAFTLLSAVLFYTIATVTRGLRLEVEALQLSIAMELAQSKMNEIIITSDLGPTETSGTLGDSENDDENYPYELIIVNDKIDLSKSLIGDDISTQLEQTLTDEFTKNEDQLKGIIGKDGDIGTAVSAFTTYDVYRIQLSVHYLKNGEQSKIYKLEKIQLQ